MRTTDAALAATASPRPSPSPVSARVKTVWMDAAASPDVGRRPVPESPVREHRAADVQIPGFTAGPHDVTMVLDPAGVVVSVSPNCRSLLGFEREELIGINATDLLHPEDRSSLKPAMRAFARGVTDHFHSSQRIRHKQRGYALVETSVRSTTGSQRPSGTVILGRAPQGLSQNIDRAAVSLAPSAIGTAYAWVMHGSRRAVISSADPVFASLLGETTASLVGHPIEQLTDPHDHAVGQARFLALLDGSGTTYQVERVVADSRTIELTVSLLPLLDKPGHMAVIQARDVSREREETQALRHWLDQLQRSNRELEAFASVAAHDLAAPLRVVVGYAEMLAKQGQEVNPQVAELLGKVASTSRRMQAQVDGLMTLARIESEELTVSSYDSRVLLDEALESLDEELSRAQVRLAIGPLPVVTCNGTGIVQVFQNLVSNGLKYGGDRPVIEIESFREPQAWRFTVLDRGIGLPDCEEEHLFELFERGGVRSRAQGAGIGLAVCKLIVERHGGRIWCNQRSGGGAEFHFTLPDPSSDSSVRAAT